MIKPVDDGMDKHIFVIEDSFLAEESCALRRLGSKAQKKHRRRLAQVQEDEVRMQPAFDMKVPRQKPPRGRVVVKQLFSKTFELTTLCLARMNLPVGRPLDILDFTEVHE
eukprot:4486344-Amphidinium_carterae.1